MGSDIGHEELLAAVNSVTNTGMLEGFIGYLYLLKPLYFAIMCTVLTAVQGLSSPLWKGTETLFRFISDKDISFLKDQVINFIY